MDTHTHNILQLLRTQLEVRGWTLRDAFGNYARVYHPKMPKAVARVHLPTLDVQMNKGHDALRPGLESIIERVTAAKSAYGL